MKFFLITFVIIYGMIVYGRYISAESWQFALGFETAPTLMGAAVYAAIITIARFLYLRFRKV